MIHVPAAIAEKLSVKEWAETVAKDVGLEVNSIEGEFAKVGVCREECRRESEFGLCGVR